MRAISVLQNTIQPYAWGSATALSDLLGIANPGNAPQAELWMGAHPKAPSRVKSAGGWVALDQLIARHPEEILGPEVAARFDRRLPFLFKVLAVGAPLSIQAHPDSQMAREGFDRENRQGIPLGAPERNYRDRSHKPECLCALTDFSALCGFRPPAAILNLFRVLCPRELAEETAAFAAGCDAGGVQRLFTSLLLLERERCRRVVGEAVANARRTGEPAGDWIPALAERYPADSGALAPALMNVLRLKPGQALFLPPGVLHAYLAGTGIEIMANSDNVVRGGLTSKHIDAAELARVVRFDSPETQLVRTETRRDAETCFLAPAAEFALSLIRLSGSGHYGSRGGRRVEILLCTDGEARLFQPTDGGSGFTITRGTSLLVPAAAPDYVLAGHADIYKATVPEAESAA